MTAPEIKEKYTRVVPMGKKWNCLLQIDHQGFTIAEGCKKKQAEWYAEMLAIALERLLNTEATR